MSLSLCGLVGSNTGYIPCDTKRGTPLQIILGSAVFQPSDYSSNATLDAAFVAKLKLPNGSSQKLYPLPAILGTNDTTEAAKYGTYGYGTKVLLTRSKQGYEFTIDAGTNLERALIKFNGSNQQIFIVDDASNIWGKFDNSKNFLGAVYQISVDAAGFQDGSNVKGTKVTLSIIDSRDFIENAVVYKTSLSVFTGLKDVYMKVLSNSVNAYKIQFFIATNILNGDLNIYDDYGALISPLTFTAFTGANFATSLAITSVAVDASTKSLLFTFDSTAYGALSTGAQIKLVPPTSTVLDNANVVGVEVGSLIITK